MASYLLDANILLRLVDSRAPEHAACLGMVEALRAESDRLILAPQALYEFWVVATRPVASNGFGWPCEDAARHVRQLLELFEWMHDPPDLLPAWIDFVDRHAVQGKRAHDARLAVFASVHDIDHLLTLNGNDFQGWGLSVRDPRATQ